MGRLKAPLDEKGFSHILLYTFAPPKHIELLHKHLKLSLNQTYTSLHIIQSSFRNKKVVTTLIGERLRKIRKQRGLTLQETADKLGVARSTYAGYESNYRQPPLEILVQISEILKTSTDYLLGLTNNPYPKEPTRNIKELLKENDLHWDGVPLTDEELKPLRDILELIVRHRLPKAIQEEKEK
jgi:transcriptional regulator with XRE-family HTH domain